MAKRGTLLIVDDNRNILSAVKLLADGHFAKVVTLSSPTTLLSTIAAEQPDVLLLDMNFNAGINSGNEGIFWLKEAKEKFPQLRVVLFTAYADIDLAVRAMKHGAFDFVVKPWDNEKMIETLMNALNSSKDKGKKVVAPVRKEVPMFWGASAEMEHIRAVVERVAVTDANYSLLVRTVRERSCLHVRYTGCRGAIKRIWCRLIWAMWWSLDIAVCC